LKREISNFKNEIRISIDRHKVELRRALNDEKLHTIAALLSKKENTTDEWIKQSQRFIPVLPNLIVNDNLNMKLNNLTEHVVQNACLVLKEHEHLIKKINFKEKRTKKPSRKFNEESSIVVAGKILNEANLKKQVKFKEKNSRKKKRKNEIENSSILNHKHSIRKSKMKLANDSKIKVNYKKKNSTIINTESSNNNDDILTNHKHASSSSSSKRRISDSEPNSSISNSMCKKIKFLENTNQNESLVNNQVWLESAALPTQYNNNLSLNYKINGSASTNSTHIKEILSNSSNNNGNALTSLQISNINCINNSSNNNNNSNNNNKIAQLIRFQANDSERKGCNSNLNINVKHDYLKNVIIKSDKEVIFLPSNNTAATNFNLIKNQSPYDTNNNNSNNSNDNELNKLNNKFKSMPSLQAFNTPFSTNNMKNSITPLISQIPCTKKFIVYKAPLNNSIDSINKIKSQPVSCIQMNMNAIVNNNNIKILTPTLSSLQNSTAQRNACLDSSQLALPNNINFAT
jgi:hypothetical protein